MFTLNQNTIFLISGRRNSKHDMMQYRRLVNHTNDAQEPIARHPPTA